MEDLGAIFGPEGALARQLPGFRPRDGQRAMADQPPPKIDAQGDAIRAALAAGKGWPAR